MITKILDKYFLKKLLDELIIDLSVYNIDKKIIFLKDNADLFIKQRKWKEDYYRKVFSVRYSNAFEIYVRDYNAVLKEIEYKIKKEVIN